MARDVGHANQRGDPTASGHSDRDGVKQGRAEPEDLSASAPVAAAVVLAGHISDVPEVLEIEYLMWGVCSSKASWNIRIIR